MADIINDPGIQKILPMLKKLPFCEGIIFSGSRLIGAHTKNSDYDFTVLISKGKSYYKIWEYQSLMVDICCATYNKIKEKDLVRSKNSNAELHIIANGQILYDKNGNLQKLKKEAQKIIKQKPKKISQADIVEIGYAFKAYIDDLNSSIEKKMDCYFLQTKILYNLIKFFFRLHQEWQPRSRSIENEIKRIDPKFWKFYEKCNLTSGVSKTNYILSMLKHLVKKFSLPQTGFIYFEKN